jgi:hypothetical protein
MITAPLIITRPTGLREAPTGEEALKTVQGISDASARKLVAPGNTDVQALAAATPEQVAAAPRCRGQLRAQALKGEESAGADMKTVIRAEVTLTGGTDSWSTQIDDRSRLDFPIFKQGDYRVAAELGDLSVEQSVTGRNEASIHLALLSSLQTR